MVHIKGEEESMNSIRGKKLVSIGLVEKNNPVDHVKK